MYIMPPRKKEGSEDEMYERFLKKLLKDPRFKQYKPMVLKALASKGFGGGRGGGRGGRGGRSSGMLQTPNQDNFIKIQSAILDTNAKLADLTNQMKRGGFNPYYYMYQQGSQGNPEASGNYAPPTSANNPQSLSENAYNRSLTRESVDFDSGSPVRRLANDAYDEGFHDFEEAEAEQGNIEQSPNIPPPEVREMGTQTEARMYDTADMLSVMSHGSIAARLKAHGYDTKHLPVGVDTLRESTAQLYKDEFRKRLEDVPGAIDLNLLQAGPRGRPKLNDPIIEPVEEGEND